MAIVLEKFEIGYENENYQGCYMILFLLDDLFHVQWIIKSLYCILP